MSLEQAITQTIAHCQAGRWQQAEILYQALRQTQVSPTQGHYWLSYIDALIQAGKPPLAPAATAVAAASVQHITKIEEIEEIEEIQQMPVPASIKLAQAPNPFYTARQTRWPWKMALGCGHVPDRKQVSLLLAHYQGGRYAQAEALARNITQDFPLHHLGWQILVAALRMQGRMTEAQQTREQHSICRAKRRKNISKEQ